MIQKLHIMNYPYQKQRDMTHLTRLLINSSIHNLKTTQGIDAEFVHTFRDHIIADVVSLVKKIDTLFKSQESSKAATITTTEVLTRRMDMIHDDLELKMQKRHTELDTKIDNLSIQLNSVAQNLEKLMVAQACVDKKGKYTTEKGNPF